MDFITLSLDDIKREQDELDYTLMCFMKAYSLPKTTETFNKLKKHSDQYVIKQMNKQKTINEREKVIAYKDSRKTSYYSSAAATSYSESFTRKEINLSYFDALVGPRGSAYDKSMFHFFSTMMLRNSLLDYYKKHISVADPSLFNAKYTMDKAEETTRNLDAQYWTINILEGKKTIPYVDVDDKTVQSYYWYYRTYLKPTWGTDVYDKGIALQDIAGKRVMVLDAEELPYTGPLGGNSKLYLIKVGYSLIPIDGSCNFWGTNYTEQEKIDIANSTAHNKDLYLMTTDLTDGTTMSATGKDDEWAERTLKSRLKRTMLKTMKIL